MTKKKSMQDDQQCAREILLTSKHTIRRSSQPLQRRTTWVFAGCTLQTKGFMAQKRIIRQRTRCMTTGGPAKVQGLCGEGCTICGRQEPDPVALTKQCQSQTKRELRRRCVETSAEPRHSPRSQRTRPKSARFSGKGNDRAFNKSYSLFTPTVGSKMSNLSHHNTTPHHHHHRSICKQALHAHTTLQTEGFDSQTAGCLRGSAHRPEQTVYYRTKWRREDFYHLPRYVLAILFPFTSTHKKKKTSPIHLKTQKAQQNHTRAALRSRHRSLVTAATL